MRQRMRLTRREAGLGLVAALAGCVSAGGRSGGGYRAADPAPRPVLAEDTHGAAE